MGLNKRLIGAGATAGAGGLTPSEHFGVVLYEGDGTSSHSINGGKFGGAANFNGTDSTIFVSNLNSSTLPTDKTWSASFWLNTSASTAGNQTPIAHMKTSSPYSGWAILIGATTIDLAINGSTPAAATGSKPPRDNNNWHHFVLSYNGSGTTTVYYDGSFKGTFSGTIGASDNHLKLGTANVWSGYKGKIDQVRMFTKAISASQAATLYAETAATVESLDPLNVDTTDTLQVLGDTSCIATYRFENDEVDLSGNYDLTGSAIQYAAGRYGQAASFNGSTSKMQASTKIMGNKTSLTLSFWAKNISVSDYSTLIGEGVDGDTAGYNVAINPNSNQIDFFRSAGTSSYVFSDNFYSFGMNGSDWVHAVFTVSPTQLKYYKNGVNVLTASISNSSTVNSAYNTSFMWDEKYEREVEGQLDQVRIFNKTLSAAEVTTLYNENPLVASYRFEGNSNDDMRTYNGTDTNVTYEFGLGFTPDLVWIKRRDAGADHALTDSTRGVQKLLSSNLNSAESNQSPLGLTSFDTGGFTLADNSGGGAGINGSGYDYVAWCFKANGGTTSSNTDGSITSTVQANQDSGFSIVTATAPSSGVFTVGHGLNAEIDLYIIKNTSSTGGWQVYVRALGANKYIELNGTDAAGTSTNFWDNTNPTSSVFTMKAGSVITGSSNFVAYCFKSIDGFSKIGTYTGNGDANGTIVETGFEPAFVLGRKISGDNWWILDNKRNTTNPRNTGLFPNSSSAELTGGYSVDFLSNGFQLKTNDGALNANGSDYIYMAFAADPDTEAPTLANSFSTVTYTGTGAAQSIDGLGFSPSLTWIKGRTNTASHQIFDTIRGATFQISSDTTGAETQNTSMLTAFDSDGFTLGGQSSVNGSGVNYVAWNFKADDNEPTIFGGAAKAVYKFEDNANDVTGTYNGTASNVSYSSSGYFNKAAEFNGSSSYVDVSYNHSNTSFSWSMWVNADSLSNSYPTVIGGMNNSTNTNNGTIWMNSSKIVIHGSTLYGEVAFSFSTSTWYHVGMVYDSVANTVKAIINGQLYTPSSTTSNTFPSQNKMRIGRADADSTAWDGKIDQVRFYKGAISDVGVAELYAETASQNDDLELGGPPEILVSANANAGFSIVKYTGNGVAGTKIPTGLSAAPTFIIVKNLTSSSAWAVYHTTLGATKYLALNETTAEATASNVWNDTAPTSTTFTVGTWGPVNTSGNKHIAYCFHDVAGYQKFGTYTGIASGNVTVTTGFRPDFVMVKCSSHGSTHWEMHDSVRTFGTTGAYRLRANDSSADASFNSTPIKYTSTGFYLDSSVTANSYVDYDANGRTYIYWAIKIN